MLKLNAYSNLLKTLIYRLLFLLLIFVFALYPVLDACAYFLNSSVVSDIDRDDADSTHATFKHISQNHQAGFIALFQQDLTIHDT